MGTYYYRVETKGRKLADGNVVHLLHFAYKPSGDWRWNERMERLKLGPTYRAWGNKPNAEIKDVLIAHELREGSAVYRMKFCGGMCSDAGLGWDDGHQRVGVLRKAGRGWRLETNEESAAEVAVMNAIIRAKTGFSDALDLLNAGGRYRPSIDMRDPELAQLADFYDRMQERRGDDRRAYRYGAHA
jgi:hypothetical protein